MIIIKLKLLLRGEIKLEVISPFTDSKGCDICYDS